jgi:hypothetical protein
MLDLVLVVAAAAAPSRLPPLSRFNTLPCVGTVASGSQELLVIGTAHTPCKSSHEVSTLIAQSRPDVVIIELDQERLESLLRTGEQGKGEQLRYGADFAAAVRGAAELGVPIVLGDAKARDLVARLRAAGAVADGERLWRAVQLALKGGRITDGVRASYVNVASSLRDDPAKMLPLLAGVWWTVLLTGLSGLATAPASPVGADEADTIPWLATAAMVLSAFGGALVLLLCVRVLDELLLRRDEILAASTLIATECHRLTLIAAETRQNPPMHTGPRTTTDCH